MLRNATIALLVCMTVTAGAAAKEKKMVERTASGEFEVKLTPTGSADAAVGTLAISKSFYGDLVATSIGQMLAVGTAVDGSAGYVAMERVTGTLGGKQGSFALQHSGTMNRGAPSLSVTVVPDSGTGDLTGISGAMTISVEGGRHGYSFRYALPR